MKRGGEKYLVDASLQRVSSAANVGLILCGEKKEALSSAREKRKNRRERGGNWKRFPRHK